MNDQERLLARLPDLTEVIIDIGIGILVIFLFLPFIYAGKLQLSHSLNYDHLVLIFPMSWRLFSNISIGTGLLGIFFAYIVGTGSRSVLWLTMTISSRFKKLEEVLARAAHSYLRRQYGYHTDLQDIKMEFVNRSAFWQVGYRNYSAFRGALMGRDFATNRLEPYWLHEKHLYFLFHRLYSLSTTFFIAYLGYGVILTLLLSYRGTSPIGYDQANSVGIEVGFLEWVIVLAILAVATLSLYAETLFHGIAFVRIDSTAQEYFMKTDGKRFKPMETGRCLACGKGYYLGLQGPPCPRCKHAEYGLKETNGSNSEARPK